MKRSDLWMAAAVLAGFGVALVPTLRGPQKAVACPVKEAADVHSARAASKSGPSSIRPTTPLSRLTGVSIRTADSGKGTTIEVETSRATHYRILHLEHPERLVLDLEGARNGTNRWRYASDSPLLKRVRLGRFSPQYGGIIRVVADLKGDPSTRVDRRPGGFRIELTPRESAGLPETAHPPTTKVSLRPAAPQIETVSVHKPAERNSQSEAIRREETPAPSPARRIALRDNPKVEVAGDPPAPASKPRAHQATRAVKVALAAQMALLRQPAVPVTQQTTLQNGPKYTGKRISLNLKDVDLKDFFRLIHEVSGLNIIVDPDVSGTVTVVLNDVPWDQALALVLHDNGLGDRLEGNVLRIAKISTLTREQEEEKKLLIAQEESEPLVTVFRPVNYAKATTLAALLKTWVGGGALSSRGSVLVDKRTNTLIISDIATHIPKIEEVINKLDQKSEQVSIQARIIRATSDFVRNFSTVLSFAQRNGSGSMVTGGATGNPVSGEPLSPPTVTTSPATGFGVFVLSNLGRNYAINAAIAAAETHDQAKTISQPSIVTQNNVEGTVIQGTQIPIQTTINNTISVQYVQASLQLKVTPQVTQNGNVFLTIEVQNSSPGPALTFAGPTINTQSATTQVLVPNGGTVIFGGVTVHTKSNSSTGVPVLDSIPLLGHLFKSTSKSTNDQELLFFVTPKILT